MSSVYKYKSIKGGNTQTAELTWELQLFLWLGEFVLMWLKRRSYLVAFSNPKPRFQEASARRQPPIVPPPQGLMCQGPDELAARSHRIFHPPYEAHGHG